jgi:hypothetical protein
MRRQSFSARFSFRPRFEVLEDRALLSAGGLKGHALGLGNGAANSAAALLSAADAEVHLTATLSGPTSATGTVGFESETEDGKTHSSFKVSVQGAAANAMLPVAINGTVVGQLNTDANGNGSLTFKSNPHGPNQSPFPANFPTSLATGDKVTVGTSLSGTLAAASDHDDEGDHDHEGDEDNGTRLTADLTGSTSATAKVSYQTETEDGTTEASFSVKVHGAAANATLPVAIDGVVVGQVMTDANGNGSLVFSTHPHGSEVAFPADFPTSLAAGATVTVGTDLSGTLAVPNHHGDEGDEGEVNLKASLTGSTAATATASFHTETDHGQVLSFFSVKVKGATAGAVLPVIVAGVNVGSITIDANGNGSLVFSTKPNGTTILPFPANFPTLAANSTITVGTILSGTFAAEGDD